MYMEIGIALVFHLVHMHTNPSHLSQCLHEHIAKSALLINKFLLYINWKPWSRCDYIMQGQLQVMLKRATLHVL